MTTQQHLDCMEKHDKIVDDVLGTNATNNIKRLYPEGSRTRSDSNGLASTPCLFQKLTEM